MKITIQSKSNESAPIVVDLPSQKNKLNRSVEMHGASILKTRNFVNFKDIKDDPKWPDIVRDTKSWMNSKNYIPCTKKDFDKWVDDRWDIKLDTKLGFNHKFLALDGISFVCMRTTTSTFSAIIPMLNLIGIPISVIKQLVQGKECFLYFCCGKRDGGDLAYRTGATICAYVDRGATT